MIAELKACVKHCQSLIIFWKQNIASLIFFGISILILTSYNVCHTLVCFVISLICMIFPFFIFILSQLHFQSWMWNIGKYPFISRVYMDLLRIISSKIKYVILSIFYFVWLKEIILSCTIPISGEKTSWQSKLFISLQQMKIWDHNF